MGYVIGKAAVLGAGVMGSGIAAHLANAGIPCLMLDIVPPNPAEGEDTSSKAFRNQFAAGGRERLKKMRPAPLTSKAALELIEIGNFDDDLDKLADCDWVVEAVTENMDIKRALFAKVETAAGPGTIVTSNTSGLSISGMCEGRSDDFRKHFMVTHFFNPVRYMKLLELVAGEETDREVVQAMHKFGEAVLGKGIVYGKDTTNFIANRIGVYGMMKTMTEMLQLELSVEQVDKIFGPAMGRPKSAVFRTADLVGLDTLVHVANNCYDTLPNDEERDVFKVPAFVTKMVEKKMLGDKTGQGFYKKSKDAAGKKVILSLDLNTLEYKEQQQVRFPCLGAARGIEEVDKRVATVLAGDDPAAKFAESVSLSVLAYASRRIPEIADDIVNIDRGLRWGFAWDLGPFEMWDAIGVQKGLDRMAALGIEPAPWVAAMVASGRTSFYAVDGAADTYYDVREKSVRPVAQSPRIKKASVLERDRTRVAGNYSASLWDMDDGVALLEFHSKMNAIDDNTVAMMHEAVDICERDYKALVIGNDSQNFSVGANLMAVLWAANAGQWDKLKELVRQFQMANQRMRYSRIPVVTAPAGMVLGGGCEVLMGGNAVQASMESYIGLVEVGVGLIPGGGGNLQLLRNLYGPFAANKDFQPLPFIAKTFMTIGMAQVATSAEEAREAGFLGQQDGISLNRDFLLSDAKAKALGMSDGFVPPRATEFLLPGPSGKATIDMLLYDMELNGNVSAHDRLIGNKLATILTGGNTSSTVPVTEQQLLDLELEAFLSLCGEDKTKARMQHMLEKGKPLRN